MARLLLKDLRPGTRYNVQLRAVEGDSVSEWSRLFEIDTMSDGIPPSVPVWAGVGAWIPDGTSFRATWQDIDPELEENQDFDHYELVISDGTNEYRIVTQGTTHVVTFEENKAQFGTPQPILYAKVRSVDASGNVSGFNTELSAQNPVPTAPASITPTAASDGIGLKWEASPDEDLVGYRVYTGTTSAFIPNAGNRIFSGLALDFTYTTLSYGIDHWFKVTAVDVFGQESSATVTGSAVRPTSPFVVDTVPPGVPTGLAATVTNLADGSGARANVSWTNPTDGDFAGTVLEYKLSTDSSWSSAFFNKDATSTIVELPTAYATYNFRVRARDTFANYSAWSTTVNASGAANTAPAQVTGVAAVAGRDSMRYTWTPSTATDLQTYEAQIATNSGFTTGLVTFKTGTSAALQVGGLTPGTTYYFRVRAVDKGALSGSYSATNTTATLAQLTPGDIGAPTTADLDDLVKSYSVEYAVNASETVAPTTGWSTATPTRNPGDFIWTRTVVTYNDNTTTTTNPALLTGNAGAPGADGNDGAPGRGISSTAVAYQVSSSGTVAPNGTWQSTPQATSPGQYLWTRTIYTYTDATSDTAYSVAAHGATGSAGAAGRGITGTTVTYQKHTNGTTAPTGTWTSAIPATAPGEFLWTRTVTNYTDSTSSTAYSVAAHGEAGSDGADGVGISSTTVTYQTHSSGTVAPTGTWSATPTATVAGQFLWTRTITNYTDASSSTAYAVAAHGADGADGADGTDGRGISSTAVTYQVHTNGTTAPTGTWTSTVPSTTAGQFLWTRTVTTYTDASTTTAYSVAAHGATGSAGADGKGISSTAVTYQTHTNGTTAPTGAWSSTPTATSPGQFLWTRTVITYTDATNSTSYAVSAHGATGSAGAAGRGISNTVVNYAKNTDGTTAPASGWGTAIPATVAGEFLWTRTVTTYTDATTTTAYSVAAHGTSGADGNDGADGVGISGTTVTYQKHTSGTTAPTGTWTAGIPATVAGEFLWTRTVTNFTDATSTTAYSVAAHGAQGPQGNVGPTGKGISSSATTYQVHTSGTTAPTGTWLSSVPSVPAGQFLWTRTIITYTDAATSTAYSVAGAGTNGTNGTNGVSVTAITRYWLRQTAGAGTPATPGNVATPGGAWTTTEPDYLAGTELWMMDRISYSNSTYAYTAPAKSSSYTAATTAITAANGKNKIIFSTGDATGTAYTAGDLWYKRDANGVIIGTWEFTTTWVSRTYGDATLASLNVGKLVSGDVSAITINVSASGVVKSTNYAAGSAGWKLDASGLELNNGAVKASALRAATLGSDTGRIDIGLGASIVMNGGVIRSNTYGSDTYNANATAGFFLSDGNLHIPDGNISAKALKAGTISGTNTITLSGAGAKIVGTGFELSGSGLTVTNGSIAAAAINITSTFSDAVGASMTTIDGGIIKTGSIQSQTNITVNGVSVPTWSINTQGYASFAGAQILGNTVLGNAGADTTSRIQSFNYTPGSTGWMIRADGTAEFAATSIRGSLAISQVTNLQTELNNKATTTYVDTTAQAKADAAEIGALSAQATNTNSMFGDWTGAYPTGYSAWAGTVVKETALAKTINAARYNLAANVDGGLNAASAFAAATHYEYVAIEIDVMLVDNGGTASFNGAGIILDWNSATYRTTLSLGAAIPAPVFGKWYKVVEVVRKPQDSADAFTGYIMANWSGFGVARDAKNIVFDRVALRPASAVEIDAVTAVSQVQDLWGAQQDRTFIDGGNIYTDTITLDALRGGSLTKVINLDTGSSLLSTGVMGEQVAMGAFGFYVKGPQENTVTNKSSSGTTRTLTTSVAHNFVIGQKIVVKIGDTSYDNSETYKFWTVAGITNATTFTYAAATSLTQASTAVTAGIVQGQNPDLPAGQDYIVFPTDGTEPNIISGQLTASNVVVTEGMSIRKTSSVEQSAQLILNSVIEAPKIAPSLAQNYSEIQISGYTGTLIDVARGHNGNYFVLAGTTNNYKVTEHNATGQLLATRVSYNSAATFYKSPMSLTYAAVNGGRYYVHTMTNNRASNSHSVETFNTSWASQGSFLIASANDTTDPHPKSRLGWDYTNNRPMLAWRAASGSSNATVRYYTYNATTGVITGIVAGDTTVAYSSDADIAFISRGNFDYGVGADRIVIKDKTYNSGVVSRREFAVATNAGATDTTKNWPVANNNTISGAFWDTTLSKFVDVNNSGTKRIYEGGDSYWASTTMTDVRWVRYAWYNTVNDAESNLSPAISISLSKRARFTATIAPVPYTGGSTPDKARVYVLDNPTDTFPTVTNYRLRYTAPYTSQTAPIDPYNLGTVGTAQPTVNDFALYGSNPGQIVSSTGQSFWKGDDTAQFKELVLISDEEASTASGNTPALRIGNVAGQHLRIDSNEIIAMESDSSRAGGELELSADTMKFNMLNGNALLTATGSFAFKIRTENSSHTAVVWDFNKIVASTPGWNGETTTANNTVDFHAKEVVARGGVNTTTLTVSAPPTGSFTNNVNWNSLNGNIRVNTSSARFKENIKDAELDVDLALSLKPRLFQRNDERTRDAEEAWIGYREDNPWYYGFIAEEAEGLGLNKFVEYDADGKPFGFDYTYWTVALQAIAQKHDKEIKKVQAEKKALEDKVEAMEERLARLESLLN